jgi:hypothetical protein
MDEYVAGADIPAGGRLVVGGVPTPASVFPRITPPAPKQPIPDGRLIIRTVHGTEHVYENKTMPRGWRPIGSGIQVSTESGRIVWTWRNILSYEIIANSDEFVHAHRRWHAWKTAEAAKIAAEEEGETCVGVDGD